MSEIISRTDYDDKKQWAREWPADAWDHVEELYFTIDALAEALAIYDGEAEWATPDKHDDPLATLREKGWL